MGQVQLQIQLGRQITAALSHVSLQILSSQQSSLIWQGQHIQRTPSASFTFDGANHPDVASLFRTMASAVQGHQSHATTSSGNPEETNEPEIRRDANNSEIPHEQASTAQSAGPTNHGGPFPSFPFNSSTPTEFADMLRTMGTAAQSHHTNEGRASGNPETQGEPEIRMDANVSFNFGAAPEQVSDALRSMMGMFAPPPGPQQDMPRDSDPN